MFSSLARLIVTPGMPVIHRGLQETANMATPPIISVQDVTAVTVAARLILSGKVIAIPTDTIYGLAVSVQNNNGIKSLYDIKKRDNSKPIAICVGDVNDIQLWGETSHLENDLLEALLPGPVTIVLKRKNVLNPLLNPTTNLVGIRVPKFSFVRNLARECGVPLALTSANLSSETSPLQISEFNHLWSFLGAVFNAGNLGNASFNRAGSTVIDLTAPGYFDIIRPGSALESTLKIVNKFGLKKKKV